MSWGAVAGAAIGVVGSQLGKDKNGGAGSATQTQTKEPWAAAAPWLEQNLSQGQALQQRYQDQPFNQQQQQAFANQYAQSDYMRSLVPSLLTQLQGQQLGFDPSNPTAKPTAFNWNASGGLLGGSGAGSMTDAASRQAALDAVKPAQAPASGFRDQAGMLSGANMTGTTSGRFGQLGTGGFGSFTYGMDVQPGTQAWRDAQEYRLMGGSDPNNLYGWNPGYDPQLRGMNFFTVDGTGEAGGGPGTSGNW